jgi:hypothetical protein
MIKNDTLITDLIKFEFNIMSKLVLISWNKLICYNFFQFDLYAGFQFWIKYKIKITTLTYTRIDLYASIYGMS